jgi:hypothetical protein
MSDLNLTASSASRVRARGSVTVGDYLGAPAAEAARAVRRLGLRPGLDRQFGGEPQTIGLVLAQQPDAGDQAQRGAMVTLYVSAPTVTPPVHEGQSPGPPRARDAEALAAPSPAAPITAARPARTRRKRRERPVAAIQRQPSSARTPEEVAPPHTVRETPEPFQSREPPDGEDRAHEDMPHGDPLRDQLTLEMRDVFHGQTSGTRDRGIYPRKPASLRVRSAISWVRAHPVRAIGACVLLTVLLSVTVARDRPESTPPPGASASTGVPESGTRAAHSATSSVSSRRRRRSSGRPARRSARVLPRRQEAARRARAAREKTPSSTVGPARETPSAAAPAGAQPAQSGGGPFSP